MKNKEFKLWLGAVGLASSLFVGFVRPTLTQALTREEVHGLFLASQEVKVEDYLDENGFRQIQYEFEGEKVKLTEEKLPHANPDIAGEWITWMTQIGGSWQVFLYSLVSQETVQLTVVGNNVNPVVSRNSVAWEGLVEGTWQVFWFDGMTTRQVTEGESVAGVRINDEWLAYRQKQEGNWKLKIQSLITEEVIDLGVGLEPDLNDERLVWKEEIEGTLVSREYWFVTRPTITLTVEPSPTVEPTVSLEEEVATTEAELLPEEVLEASISAEVEKEAF